MALWSLYTLYAVETGGVFFGGLFTLVAGVALAVAVLAKNAVRWSGRRDVPRQVRERFGG